MRSIVDGATDISALALLADKVSLVDIRHLPRIHAKVYVANEDYAIISSANFTDGGVTRNFEYGVALENPEDVSMVVANIREYAVLGGLVTRERLQRLHELVTRVRSAVQVERRAMNAALRRAVLDLEAEAELELLRSRIEGRSVNAVFSDTLRYLLKERPMTTVELHERIHEMHPDLCDDTTERVIDGQRFGKLWKHQVRTAQQHLKKSGAIEYDPRTRLWFLSFPA